MQVGWVKIDEYLETVQHRRMVSSKVAPCVRQRACRAGELPIGRPPRRRTPRSSVR